MHNLIHCHLKNSLKKAIYFILFLIFFNKINAQITPQKVITTAFIDSNITVLENKKIPPEFKTQINGAMLYFPELKRVNIKFIVKKTKSPLAARPTFWSIFKKAENRTYLITISEETSERFSPILLKNLSFNAQIGVLGHELSHIAFYNQQKGIYFIGLIFKHLSVKAMDTFENDTDKSCIDHKLGYQLLAWSTEVRAKLNIRKWRGVDNHSTVKRER